MENPSLELMDSHAHIYLDDFQDDIDSVISRAGEAGLSRVYMPNIDSGTIDSMLNLARRYPTVCYPMIGLHPCSVNDVFEKELHIVEEWLEKEEFVAIGEIGTDLYWDKTYWEQQQEAFRIQVGLAKKVGKPIVIHCRQTLDQTIQLVEQMNDDNLIGVFHCFTGTIEQAQRITDMGFYLGIGGVATFKNGGMDKVVPHLNLDRMVLETDSPYLTPTPHRGKRNEPSYLSLIAQRVAEIMGTSFEEVVERTTSNTRRLFTSTSV